jgi:WD40 repeat protein
MRKLISFVGLAPRSGRLTLMNRLCGDDLDRELTIPPQRVMRNGTALFIKPDYTPNYQNWFDSWRADVIVLCSANRIYLQELSRWYAQARFLQIPIILVETKCELPTENNIDIQTTIDCLQSTNIATMVEVSARDNVNIAELWEIIERFALEPPNVGQLATNIIHYPLEQRRILPGRLPPSMPIGFPPETTENIAISLRIALDAFLQQRGPLRQRNSTPSSIVSDFDDDRLDTFSLHSSPDVLMAPQFRHAPIMTIRPLRSMLADQDNFYTSSITCAHTAQGLYVVSLCQSVEEGGISKLQIWSLSHESCIKTLSLLTSVTELVLLPNGSCLTNKTSHLGLNAWNLSTGSATLLPYILHDAPVTSLALTSNGQYLVSGAADGGLKIWNLTTRTLITSRIIGHALTRIKNCQITSDNKYVIALIKSPVLAERMAIIWEWQTDKGIWTKQLNATSRNIALTVDNQWLIYGNGIALHLWNWELNQEIVLIDHPSDVTTCAAIPHSPYVVSGSADGTLQIWNWQQQTCVAILQGHTGSITACTVTPDGLHVISATNNGEIKIWGIQEVCSLPKFTRKLATHPASGLIAPIPRRIVLVY